MANEVLGEKREGNARIRSNGGIPTIEETYSFVVKSDDKNNSRFTILATDGLPIVNYTVSSYGLTVCRSKDAVRREENPLIWDVTCEFSSEVEENQGGSQGQDPESDPETWIPVYETKFERYQEYVIKDLAGTPVANSVGVTFSPGLAITRKYPVWEFYQIEPASVSDETIIDRMETINSVAFKGRAVRTLRLDILSSVKGYYYGAPRRLTHYTLTYNKRNWKHKRHDVGSQYISGGNFEPYLDNQGNQFEGPLNGTGGKVAVGADPAVLEFDIYTEVDFHSFLRT